MIKNKQKVIVAMSGGVDSSVATALLKKEGYEVAGVFMHFWSETAMTTDYGLRITAQNTNACCSAEAEMMARAVAAKLKIPFYVFHFEEEFKKQVVDYFLAEEAAGRTPNPCVVCNKKIKFGLMFDRAMALGADFVATGHYARKVVIASPDLNEGRGNPADGGNKYRIASSPRRCGTPRNDSFSLFAAKDANKDQSYFLYNLTQEKLARILFPLGDYLKLEVYALAKKWRLPYRKDESFDICFAGRDLDSFIRRYLKLKAGEVVKLVKEEQYPPLPFFKGGNRAGGDVEILGEHDGLPFYTIGQRKRLPLSQGPWFVAGKDERKNILFVTKNEKDLYSSELCVGDVNWLSGAQPELPMKVFVKIRYKSEAAEATLRLAPLPLRGSGARSGRKLEVKFTNPQRAITAGQSAVFYSKNGELLGGGVID